jgi:DNA-directed RNA polymerase specialized sigma subunit
MHPIGELGELVGTAENRGSCNLGRQEVVSLLAELPPASRKVLAMFYHEKMQSIEIADCLGLTEPEICKIHAQIVASIHRLLAK